MRRFLLLGLLIVPIGLGAEQAYWLAHHKLVYGTWLVYNRPITRADVTCEPPNTILIRPGEYYTLNVPEMIDWCGFQHQETFSGTPPQ